MSLTPEAVLPVTLQLLDSVYQHTAYEDPQDAQAMFAQLRANMPSITNCPDGKKLVQKFCVLSRTISTEGTFMDMVKIIWRMVKTMQGNALHKLGLFLVALSTLCESLKTLPVSGQSGVWRQKTEVWLGKQLTIGGKGVTGEGEGTAIDRVSRFFSTPYLHDFD